VTVHDVLSSSWWSIGGSIPYYSTIPQKRQVADLPFLWWGRISELKKAEGDPEKIRASLDESERLLTADLGLADKMHGREA
jgi:hypothetical protein